MTIVDFFIGLAVVVYVTGCIGFSCIGVFALLAGLFRS